MATNSYNRGDFARNMQNNASFQPSGDDASRIAYLKGEHAAFLARQAAWEEWAKTTKLGDVIIPFVEVPFRTIYTLGVNEKWQVPMLTINPKGESKTATVNSHSDVNGLVKAFGIKSFPVLHFGWHDKEFDKSLTRNSGVHSVLEPDGQYRRYAWNGGAYVLDMPKNKPGDNELDNWLGLHQEIDALLDSFMANNQYIVNFFNPKDYDRFLRNVHNNLDKTVREVATLLGENAAMSSMAARINNLPTPVAPVALVVGGVDLSKVDHEVILHVVCTWSKSEYDKPVDLGTEIGKKWLAGTLADPTTTLTIVKA